MRLRAFFTATAAFALAAIPVGLASDGPSPFKDCDTCPEMVALPASPPGFQIGSPEDEPGHLPREERHPVSIKPFAIGQHEVSVAEYKQCVTAGACRPPEWLEPGGQHNVETGVSGYYRNYGDAIIGERQPIVGVDRHDAAAFAGWLSKTTGKRYRLPSEAEWEYAARAGTTTAYWWGAEVARDGSPMANCRGCGSTFDGRSLAPVDAFEPNAFGLFNVHGNVWEWVADYDCEDFASGPTDGSARVEDNCAIKDAPGLFVLRGGSAFYEAGFARAATRLRNVATFRNVSVGFRVARDVDP